MAANDEGLKGYVHEFLEPPPGDLLCLICLCVARDPQQINCCGKVLCKGCLKQHKRYSNNCPQCRKPIRSFADKRSERDILSLKALCDNRSNSCEWMGALRSLNGHLATCKFALLLCPNECQKAGKVVELLRKDIETHTKEECPRRQYECPHCKEFGEHHERTTEHLSVCPMKEVPCPKLGCRMNIARRNLSEHRKECKFEMVPCKYEIIGCKTEVLRKDMAKHEEDTQQHLQLAVDTVRQQQITIREQDSTIRDMQAQSRKMPMTFKLTNFNQHKTADNTFYSPAFYTSPGGYKMCIDVEANGYGEGKGTYVSVYAHLMKGENDDYLSWPFTGTLTIELLNQLEDNNHQSEIIIFPADDDKYGQRVLTEEIASSAWGCPLYISHSNLAHNAAKNCQYLKDDRLHFRISANAKESSTPWLI